jgi:hypothetical protein
VGASQKDKKIIFLSKWDSLSLPSKTNNYENLINTRGIRKILLQLTFAESHYKAARKKLDSPCFEDVLLQILKDGKPLKIVDHGCDGEYNRTITLKDVHEKVQTTDAKWLLQMEHEEDDAVTADCILQTVFFGEIVFG